MKQQFGWSRRAVLGAAMGAPFALPAFAQAIHRATRA